MVSMLPVASSERDEFLRMAVAHFSQLDASFVPQDDWTKCYFETILAAPQFFLRWIVCQEQRAGFILFGLEKHRFLPRQTGAIYEVYVGPSFVVGAWPGRAPGMRSGSSGPTPHRRSSSRWLPDRRRPRPCGSLWAFEK
jgi:hypothetical protein